MNPEDMQGLEGMAAMTPEQEAQQQAQDEQLAASGADPENGQMPEGMDPAQDPSSLVPNADMQDPSIGMQQEQPGGAPDPMDALAHVVLSYMDYTTGIKNNKLLDEQTRSGIMLQMAQAINYFVPLLKDDQQGELMMKQAEMDLKRQEHEMNMEMKQLELGYKMQEHDMKMNHSQQENEIKLNHAKEESKMKLQQGKENHQASIVQSKEAHKSKMEQQKQAAQLKASSKPSNDQGKK